MTPWRGVNKMGFLFLMLGGVFVCFPVVGFFDVLPDLFGYALICLGLWRLSDLSDSFSEAMAGFRKMIWVSVGQLAAQWYIHDFYPEFTRAVQEKGELAINELESPTLILLASFVWVVLSWIFLIPAMKSLFEGFGGLAMRYEGDTAIAQTKRGRTDWERMQRKSIAMAVALPLCATLPELAILTTMDMRSEKPIFSFDWYPYITLFRTVFAVVAAIFGMVWLISFLRFLIKITRDRPFFETLSQRYERELMPRVIWRKYRRVSLAFALFSAALLLAVNVRVDGRPIAHGGIPVLLFIIGYVALGAQKRRLAYAWYAVGALTVVASEVHSQWITEYLLKHEIRDAGHIPRAYNDFLPICYVECIHSILLAAFLILFLILLWRSLLHIEAELSCDLMGKERKRYFTRLSAGVLFTALMGVVSVANAFLQIRIGYLWWIVLLLYVAIFFACRGILTSLSDELFSYAKREYMNKDSGGGAY